MNEIASLLLAVAALLQAVNSPSIDDRIREQAYLLAQAATELAISYSPNETASSTRDLPEEEVVQKETVIKPSSSPITESVCVPSGGGRDFYSLPSVCP